MNLRRQTGWNKSVRRTTLYRFMRKYCERMNKLLQRLIK